MFLPATAVHSFYATRALLMHRRYPSQLSPPLSAQTLPPLMIMCFKNILPTRLELRLPGCSRVETNLAGQVRAVRVGYKGDATRIRESFDHLPI